MIVFVIVTALLNIALGYALAIYLGRAQGYRTRPSAITHEIPADVSLTIPAPQAAPAPAPPVAMPVTSEATGTELEQDVLAGIEEFRNQLAQMKAQPEEELAVAAG